MLENKDISSIEKNLRNLPREKIHKLLLLHLSEFSDFFLNIASYGGEVEKTLGSRDTPLTAIRAGIIIGPGGSSFKIVKNLVKNLPVMACPQ